MERLCIKIYYIKQSDEKADIQHTDKNVCYCKFPEFLLLPGVKNAENIPYNLLQIPVLTIKVSIIRSLSFSNPAFSEYEIYVFSYPIIIESLVFFNVFSNN
jgi:hypothetical protein